MVKRGKDAAPEPARKRRTILRDEEIAQYLACTKRTPQLGQLMSLVARVEGGMRTGDLNRWEWSQITTTDFTTCVVPRSKTNEPQVLEIPEVLRDRLRARWEAAGKPSAGPCLPRPPRGQQRGLPGDARDFLRGSTPAGPRKAGLTRHELFHETEQPCPSTSTASGGPSTRRSRWPE